MNRTTFIVDGFNLYHSVCDASRALGLAGAGVKWLNLRKLCESYLSLIGGPAQLERIYYFSALATHLESAKPDLTLRHRAYLAMGSANARFVAQRQRTVWMKRAA
ncbi:MAG TPA: hypothetical protein VF701_07085 [Thermoanaerobaculia bacterium]